MDDRPSPDELLRRISEQNAELRELLTLVAEELERLAGQHPALASRLRARAQRLRRRLWHL